MIERRTLCVLETTRLACPDSQPSVRTAIRSFMKSGFRLSIDPGQHHME